MLEQDEEADASAVGVPGVEVIAQLDDVDERGRIPAFKLQVLGVGLRQLLLRDVPIGEFRAVVWIDTPRVELDLGHLIGNGRVTAADSEIDNEA